MTNPAITIPNPEVEEICMQYSRGEVSFEELLEKVNGIKKKLSHPDCECSEKDDHNVCVNCGKEWHVAADGHRLFWEETR